MLVPRMTMSDRNAITTPATGLLIYQTDNTSGFYYYNGSGWISLINAFSGWGTTGNAGTDPATNFLGTTDDQPLFFKLNNFNAGRWDKSKANYLIGANAGTAISTGTTNIGIGTDVLSLTNGGSGNLALGHRSLKINTSGSYNAAIGYQALFNNTGGSFNTALGHNSLAGNITGSRNTILGSNANVSSGALTNATAVGANALVGCSNCFVLGGTGTDAVNVGIGVTNPFSKLTVNGDAAITSTVPTLRLFRNPSAGVSRILFQLNDSTNEFAITHALNSLYLSRGSGMYGFVSDLVIANNGNVGIGTGTPAVKLHISSSQTDLLRLETTDAAVNPQLSFANSGVLKAVMRLGGDDMVLGSPASNNNGKFILRLNGGDRFTVQPDGKVLIGTNTAAAGYMLNVNGKAICTELKVQLQANWPDYVFKKNYQLKSFDELRNFIAVNNHLPGMPAASEIQNSGMEVGEMQRKMMEKIEELTLYVLQLENKIIALEKLKRPSEQKIK